MAADPAPERIKFFYDAIVIGTGLGGSTLAYSLGKAGQRVLIVERGGYLKPSWPGDPAPRGRYLYHVAPDRSEPLSYVGGQTKFYGSALYRLRESDFQAVEHESGISPKWPIDYAALEPYYEQAEALFRVHGELVGDPSEPPHRAPFPFPPLPNAKLMAKLAQRLQNSGTSVSAIPRGLDYHGGGPCVLCPTCDAHFCQTDAKMDAEIAALRPALATGNVQIATETECVRIVTNNSGKRATGVVLRCGGAEHCVNTDTVAVGAGLRHSAVLLHRSRTASHPNGLGNASGSLGRYLGAHSVGMIFPFVSLRKLKPTHTKSFAINQFYDSAPGWDFPTGVIQTAGQTPFWEEASRVVRPIARLVGQHAITCFYMTEALPSRETGMIFNEDSSFANVDAVQNMRTFERLRRLAMEVFDKAGYRTLARKRPPYQWHEVGTARFGEDPANSVADPNCQVHGISGLYVVDASVLPSAGAVNTGLSIIALALRTGEHIAKSGRSMVAFSAERECAAGAWA